LWVAVIGAAEALSFWHGIEFRRGECCLLTAFDHVHMLPVYCTCLFVELGLECDSSVVVANRAGGGGLDETVSNASGAFFKRSSDGCRKFRGALASSNNDIAVRDFGNLFHLLDDGF
jgi:hypothetical protein